MQVTPACGSRFGFNNFPLPHLFAFTFWLPFGYGRPQAPGHSLLPQVNEVTRHADGFHLFSSHLQLRLHLDDQRFISKSEVLQLSCTADIMGIASVRRESRVETTILALKDAGTNQRLTENGSCITGQPGECFDRLKIIKPVIQEECFKEEISNILF